MKVSFSIKLLCRLTILCFEIANFLNPPNVTANAKRQCNTTMTVQTETYRKTKTRVTDRLVNWTSRHASRPDEVLFFAHPHFLFFNFTADAHLAHCLLPDHTQAKQKGKSQRAKFRHPQKTILYLLKMKLETFFIQFLTSHRTECS